MPKRKPKADSKLLPAIVALRNVHAQAFPGIERHGLCATDLVHDERAINTYPEDPFAWIMTPHSTHMVRASADDGALIRGRSQRSGASFLRSVAETFDPKQMLFCVWNGYELRMFASVDNLIDAFIGQCRRLRAKTLRAVRQTAAENLAKHGDCSDNYYANTVARLDAEIAELEGAL